MSYAGHFMFVPVDFYLFFVGILTVSEKKKGSEVGEPSLVGVIVSDAGRQSLSSGVSFVFSPSTPAPFL